MFVLNYSRACPGDRDYYKAPDASENGSFTPFILERV